MQSNFGEVLLEPGRVEVREHGLADPGAVGRAATAGEGGKPERLLALDAQNMHHLGILEDTEAGTFSGVGDEALEERGRTLRDIEPGHRGEAKLIQTQTKAITAGLPIHGHETMPPQRLEKTKCRALMETGLREVRQPFFDGPGRENLEEEN